jgi:3-phenylpropionate/trans-cinnamate dioxygenase ferredoxin subunit
LGVRSCGKQPVSKKRLNMAEFVTVVNPDDILEGELAAFVVNGTRIALTDVGGAYYAFGATCTHLHCSLAEGEMEGTTVKCRRHGSQFAVTTGAVLRGPARDPVASYPVRLEGNALQGAV